MQSIYKYLLNLKGVLTNEGRAKAKVKVIAIQERGGILIDWARYTDKAVAGLVITAIIWSSVFKAVDHHAFSTCCIEKNLAIKNIPWQTYIFIQYVPRRSLYIHLYTCKSSAEKYSATLKQLFYSVNITGLLMLTSLKSVFDCLSYQT